MPSAPGWCWVPSSVAFGGGSRSPGSCRGLAVHGRGQDGHAFRGRHLSQTALFIGAGDRAVRATVRSESWHELGFQSTHQFFSTVRLNKRKNVQGKGPTLKQGRAAVAATVGGLEGCRQGRMRRLRQAATSRQLGGRALAFRLSRGQASSATSREEGEGLFLARRTPRAGAGEECS